MNCKTELAKWILYCALFFSSTATWAAGEFIDIQPRTEAEIQLVLDTLESSILEADKNLPPIVMMLHGKEANRFLRSNYSANKAMVDQTAKLAAYNVIKVQICLTWMADNMHAEDELFPFVSTVPFAPDELERLVSEESYTEFSVSL